MVTILKQITYDGTVHDVRCLSTDTKPTEGIANGSTCIEINTGKLFIYDKNAITWHEL